MRKLYLSLLFLFVINLTKAQFGTYGEILIPPIRDIEFFDASHGIAYGQGTIMVTADEGASWDKVEFPLLYHHWAAFTSCAILDENTAIIVGDDGLVIKTEDKGLTWDYIPLQIAGNEDGTCARHPE